MFSNQKASAHWDVHDLPGALAFYDRAVAIYRKLVAQEAAPDLSLSWLWLAGTRRKYPSAWAGIGRQWLSTTR
jgi:hypothetical protein